MRKIAASIFALAFGIQAAFASQATLVTPSAPLPMTSLATFLNAAYLSIGSHNSGNSAPTNGPGTAAFAGESWCNTTAATWVCNITDNGTNWAPVGYLNSTTHVWTAAKAAGWNGGYVAGRYYLGMSSGAVGTGALAANTAYFFPFAVGEAHTFDRISVQVTTAGTANNARLAIYNSAGGQPTSLVVDGGVVGGVNPMQSTGLKTVTISQVLSPGVYQLAIVVDGSVTVAAIPFAHSGMMFFSGTTDFVTADTLLNATLTYGAFPATAFTGGMGSITYSSSSSPALALRG